jgi:hypothetical protein
MSRAIKVTPTADRSGTQPGPWIVCGLVALLAAAALSLLFWRLSAEYHEYQTAPWCNTLPTSAERNDCRYGLSATVTEVHIGSGKGARYWLTVQAVPPANGELSFPDEADVLDVVTIGDTVHVEVWRGRVVRVDTYGYSDETSAAPRYGRVTALAWLVASAFAALWLLAAGLGRRSWVQWLLWFRVVVDVGLVAVTLIALLAALFVMADPSLALFWYALAAVLVIPGTVVAWRKQYRRPARALPVARKRPARRRARRTGAWITACTAILGLLAAGAAVTALIACVRGLGTVNAYRNSPDCPEVMRGDCRHTLTATVVRVRVVDGGGSANWLYLDGPDPAQGIVDFSGSTDFLQAIHAGDRVQAEVWRGEVRSVAAHGQVVGTSETPTDDGALAATCAALAGALLFLRGCAHRRRRWLPWRAIGTPLVEVVVVALTVVGTVLLGFDVAWGAVPVGLALAVLLYGAAAPTLTLRREADLADSVY